MKWQKNRLLLIYVALLLVLLTTTDANGQTDAVGVYVEAVEGAKVDTQAAVSAVVVKGKAVNPLSWTAIDVEITVVFLEDTQEPFVSHTISQVPPQGVTDFLIEKTSNFNLQTFYTAVTNYRLQSDEVSALLDLYHLTTDPVLQGAVVQTFQQMSLKAMPALLQSIEVMGRPAAVSLEQVYADLLCLDALYTLGASQSVQSLLRLLAWYDQNQALDLRAVETESMANPASPAGQIALLKNFNDTEHSLADLVQIVLLKIGTPGIPYLLRAANSNQPIVREVVQATLVGLGKTTVPDLLADPDPAIRADIIAALGETGRSEAVLPMVELAIHDPSTTEAVDQSLLKMGSVGVWSLLSALGHRHSKVADYAERVLRAEAEKVAFDLQQALLSWGQPVPPNLDEPEALVTAARSWADRQVNLQVDAAFEKGWTLFQQHNCADAAKAMDAMFTIRDTVPRYAIQAAQVYQCQARTLAAADALAQAIALGLQAEQADPHNVSIQSDLAAWFTSLGQAAYKAENWQEAAIQFQAALQRSPATVATIVPLLRLAHDHASLRDIIDARLLQAGREVAFTHAWNLFQTGACEAAFAVVEAMTVMQDAFTQHATQAAQIYHCQARRLANTDAYSQTIALGLQAEQLDSDNTVIQIDLAEWFTALGQIKYTEGHTQEAGDLLQLALDRHPTHPLAQFLFRHVVLREASVYLWIGAVYLALLIVVANNASRIRSHPHA